MRHNYHLALLLHEARERNLQHAGDARLRSSRLDERGQLDTRGLRRRLGRSLVRIGNRLAADPTFKPARSR